MGPDPFFLITLAQQSGSRHVDLDKISCVFFPNEKCYLELNGSRPIRSEICHEHLLMGSGDLGLGT